MAVRGRKYRMLSDRQILKNIERESDRIKSEKNEIDEVWNHYGTEYGESTAPRSVYQWQDRIDEAYKENEKKENSWRNRPNRFIRRKEAQKQAQLQSFAKGRIGG